MTSPRQYQPGDIVLIRGVPSTILTWPSTPGGFVQWTTDTAGCIATFMDSTVNLGNIVPIVVASPQQADPALPGAEAAADSAQVAAEQAVPLAVVENGNQSS